MINHNEYARTAVEAARRGAAILQESANESYEVEHKTSYDLVSEVDLRSENAVIDRIRSEYPDHAFHAEESGVAGEAEERWIVDPLDGTNNYVNGFPHYCVTIALEIEGELEVGVIVEPPSGDTYTALRGEGAYRNGEPVTVSGTDTVRDGFLGSGILPPTKRDEDYLSLVDGFVRAEIPSQGIRCVGTGARDLTRVAQGQFDGFFDKHTSPWDVAAGTLLVTEAGGRVTDFRGDPLDFGKGERGLHVVATNGEIHDELLELYEERSSK